MKMSRRSLLSASLAATAGAVCHPIRSLASSFEGREPTFSIRLLISRRIAGLPVSTSFTEGVVAGLRNASASLPLFAPEQAIFGSTFPEVMVDLENARGKTILALLSAQDAVLVNEGLREIGAKIVSHGNHSTTAHRFITGSRGGIGNVFASSPGSRVGNCTVDEICLGNSSVALSPTVSDGSEWPYRLGYVLSSIMAGSDTAFPASMLRSSRNQSPFDIDLVSIVSKI
ncbi:hypothetical protein [Bradyrhizobium sp. BR 10261]|uniref:hypothetical protein n=1 Tax=Bradyrhizobium sp. BR 10261 TaxID=2749992 RepID=UPI001C645370|nr:hypothetical protein [Bradyrhizobium sp. BR 10261]MBW7965508.1 hypothetical protein [Bradyrhizobium sp. BR 10261]